MDQNRYRKTAGALLLIQSLLIFVPMGIMGPATGWPATVGEPGSKMLPIVMQHLPTVRLGYFIYLLYSMLFFVTAIYALAAFMKEEDSNPLLLVGVIAAGISSVTRCVGIVRWLTAMPVLGLQYAQASTPEAKMNITNQFDVINAWGGSGVGEVLGVGVFAAIWVFVLSSRMTLPMGIRVTGYFVAALMATSMVELLGIDLGAFASISSTALHLWLLALSAHTIISLKKAKGQTNAK